MKMLAGALALLVGVLAAACDSPSGSGPGAPARLDVLSGDLQTDTVGRELAQPLVVRVVDDRDRPVRNQLVNFVVTAGGGSVYAGAALTNADGEARERWTLGTVAGDTQRVEARAVSAGGGQALVFAVSRAVGLPDAPATAGILGSPTRAGAVSAPLADSLAVKVLDRYGNGVPGVSVTFAAQNGGAVSPASVLTRQDGRARAQWTLGAVAGPQTATATAGGSAAMTFTAAASPGAVARVALLPDSLRFTTLGRTQALAVQAFDASGNLVGGQTATLISQNAAVAALDSGSVARAAGNGTTRVIATVAGSPAADTLTVTVRQVPARIDAYVSIFGAVRDSTSVVVGSTVPVYAFVRDSSGADVPLNFATWTSRRGRVSFDGVVQATGVAPGTDTVDVRGGTAADFVVLTVRGELSGTQVTGQPCALDRDGAAWCWGVNMNGLAGTGTPDGTDSCRKNVPGAPPLCLQTARPVAGGHIFAQLADSGPCALTPAGAAYCWGSNGQGQLGTGDTLRSLYPVAVRGNHVFTRIVAGGQSACGLTASGDLYCWGRINSAGQPTPDLAANSTPRLVPGGLKFASISMSFHACGLTPGGQAYCWGRNTDGELGDGTWTDRAVPTPVSGNLTFSRISAGGRATCGLRTDGAAFCWGNDFAGTLGLGTFTNTSHPAPMQVVGGMTFASISQGTDRTCALTAEGVAYCWGILMLDVESRVRAARNTPEAVPGGFTFKQVATSFAASCGVGTDDRVRCWGWNFFAKLGNGSVVDSYDPVQVLTL